MDPNGSRLLLLAQSPSWAERADAGGRLAAFAGEVDVVEALDQLLLDSADLAVTVATAEALLARRDLVGLRVFNQAYGRAGAQTLDNLNDSMYSSRQSEQNEGPFVDRLRTLASNDGDDAVRKGAAEALRWVGRA